MSYYYNDEKSCWEKFLDWDDDDCVFASFIIPMIIGVVPGMIICATCCEAPESNISPLINLGRIAIENLTIFCGFFLALIVNAVGNIIRVIRAVFLNIMNNHNENEKRKTREYEEIESKYSRLIKEYKYAKQ